ncbi:glycosyltransferase [Geomonas sp. Red32]|uniref:CgeB family protein n=1 Tax=Geomonas sp. Red32 TaxID=2912856 RepID=UPI00202D0378|nr:glycosyltransferase [Geomonas sp. Red32]MCM0083492.1 glycosyltransferase [Geomonas sp. Red32]
MRLVRITTLYPSYLARFYAQRPGLAGASFAEQKVAFDFDASGSADFWSHALAPLGYQGTELILNAEPMQRAWARENGFADPAGVPLDQIAIEQVRRFRPEVLWFDDSDERVLAAIRSAVPSIRLALGWTGSAVPRSTHWRHLDLVLSCAPESVEYLRAQGVPAEHLHHSFDPRINERLAAREKLYPLSFIGQLIRTSQFHLQREELLLALAKVTEIAIFSSSARLGRFNNFKAWLSVWIHHSFNILKRVGIDRDWLARLPQVGWIAEEEETPPSFIVHPALRPFLKPDVYGLEMFQVLRDSKIALNIHADSSPRYASNMRLFEITGVGGCMVADWKENFAELFVPDQEVVLYRSPQECLEKVRWLCENPAERERIAAAGQQRTLSCHTFAHRAVELDGIIRRFIAGKRGSR